MSISNSFLDYVVEQLVELGDVKAKKMFGGAALYFDGLIFALIAEDILYFKVDNSNRKDYIQKGRGPFKPFDDRPMVMPYYEVPADVLENRKQLAEWARKSLTVSINTNIQAKGTKGKKQPFNFVR
ncbi:MAG: TfoX/Sxy family protein [Dehalobacterium sp.]